MAKLKFKFIIKSLKECPKCELPKKAVRAEMPLGAKKITLETLPPGLFLLFICLSVSMKIGIYRSQIVDAWLLLAGLGCGIFFLFGQELLHTLIYPKDATVIIGFYKSTAEFMSAASYPLNRKRYLLINLVHFVVGLIPIMCFIFFPYTWTTANSIVLGIAIFCGMFGFRRPYPDYKNVWQVLTRTPKGSEIQFNEYGLYYIKPKKKFVDKRSKKIKILTRVSLSFLAAIITALPVTGIVRTIGRRVNAQVPEGGINVSAYVEINNSKQWINVYGKNKKNPVLLYLHGGPGSATSTIDYEITHQWADIYTVVTWDQRNCGKSYSKNQSKVKLTYDLLMSDGEKLTKFLLEHLGKKKITILGHSWGTYLGANLVLKYPEYYDKYIGVGQLVDMKENERQFKIEALNWTKDDPKYYDLATSLDPENLTIDYFNKKNKIMEKYGYGMMVDGYDYNVSSTIFFNPHYSLVDLIKYTTIDSKAYMDFTLSDEFEKFSLLGKTNYQVPFYNINGDKDYQTNFKLAQSYFDSLSAPKKEMIVMENTTHGLLLSKSKQFSEILHSLIEQD